MSYIEREALLEEIQEELDFESTMYTEEQNKYITLGLKIAQNDIKRRPAADVVPVVRCEDCKHLIQEIIGGDLELRCACLAGMIIPAPDRYCSCGERREE